MYNAVVLRNIPGNKVGCTLNSTKNGYSFLAKIGKQGGIPMATGQGTTTIGKCLAKSHSTDTVLCKSVVQER